MARDFGLREPETAEEKRDVVDNAIDAKHRGNIKLRRVEIEADDNKPPGYIVHTHHEEVNPSKDVSAHIPYENLHKRHAHANLESAMAHLHEIFDGPSKEK